MSDGVEILYFYRTRWGSHDEFVAVADAFARRFAEARKAQNKPAGALSLRFGKEPKWDELAKRMERWFRFAFLEFLPMTGQAAYWKPPDRAALLRAWGAVPCPECGVPLLPRVGQVGLPLDEATGK